MTTSQPEWITNTREMVRNRRAIKGRDQLRGVALNILIAPYLSTLLNRAAQKRHMNRSAYTRRALAIHLAHDLDVPLGSVLAVCPLPVSWAGRAMFANHQGTVEMIVDNGADIETWCPHPGCDGIHFREDL